MLDSFGVSEEVFWIDDLGAAVTAALQ